MIYCHMCGTQNLDTSKKCYKCSTKLALGNAKPTMKRKASVSFIVAVTGWIFVFFLAVVLFVQHGPPSRGIGPSNTQTNNYQNSTSDPSRVENGRTRKQATPDDVEVKGTLAEYGERVGTYVATGTATNISDQEIPRVTVIANVNGFVSFGIWKYDADNSLRMGDSLGVEKDLTFARGYDTFRNLRSGETRDFRIECHRLNAAEIVNKLPAGKYPASTGVFSTSKSYWFLEARLD